MIGSMLKTPMTQIHVIRAGVTENKHKVPSRKKLGVVVLRQTHILELHEMPH